MSASVPVSYTQRDVYKRQGHLRGAGVFRRVERVPDRDDPDPVSYTHLGMRAERMRMVITDDARWNGLQWKNKKTALFPFLLS